VTEKQKRALLTTFATAWSCADVDTLMECMTDDCVYSASVGREPGTTYRGREEVRRGFEEILAFEAGGEQRAGNAWVAGEYAFSEWSYDEEDDAGNVVDIKGIDVFRFVGGKLQLKDAYRKTRV
jgi:ketosteroid isomerase-like protein